MSIETRGQHYAQRFGDWHIEQRLGSGSNGRSAVFKAYRDGTDWREYCALKAVSLISEQGTKNAMSQNRLQEYSTTVQRHQERAENEVRLMAQLRGKTNIVDYQDYQIVSWREPNAFGMDLIIRMELLQDLRSQIRQGHQFSEAEILHIGLDLCEALRICHSKNILHRDIKPENIFFNEDGDYKLGDFGISRILDSSASVMASTGVGTIAYCAPEQLTGKYDHRVDIYSLGLVLYELCNQNRLPFAATSYIVDDEILRRLRGETLPQPAGPVSPGLKAIVMKCCAYQQQYRFQSADELKAALNNIASGNCGYDTDSSGDFGKTVIQNGNFGSSADDSVIVTVPPIHYSDPPANHPSGQWLVSLQNFFTPQRLNDVILPAAILFLCLLLGTLLGAIASGKPVLEASPTFHLPHASHQAAENQLLSATIDDIVFRDIC